MEENHRTRRAGQWYLSIVGLALCVIAGLFFWLMLRSYLRAKEMAGWPQEECIIASSAVEKVSIGEMVAPEYRLAVSYHYSINGVEYESHRWGWRGSMNKARAEEVEELVKQYAVGSRQHCWVNPAQPDFAILQLDSRAAGYSLWFPGLFFVGGVGMIVGAWKKPANNANDSLLRKNSI